MPWINHMDRLILQKIKDILAKNNTIGIAVGKNPGIDEMGATLALYLCLSQDGKSVSIACPTEPIVEVSSLVGIDKVKTSFDSGAGGDLTVSFPYKEGEIEKISYTLEDGFLNILVKAGEQGLSFNEKDIEYKRIGSAPNVLFVVGTPRLSDLGKLFDPQALKDVTIINIDNKADNQGYGDIVLVSKKLSSVSEQMVDIILSLDLKMDQDAAQNLLSGVSSATDNFQHPNTSPLAFEMAANLMKRGAIRTNSKFIKSTTDGVRENYSFFAPKPTKKEEKKDNNPPEDWLAPKIYKGSTAI